MREPATIVVPCFDERERLDEMAFVRLADADAVRVLLVDDGSTDGTWGALEAIARRRPARIGLLRLDCNHGKDEAVRRGLVAAIGDGAAIVGYLDADLSTPVCEAQRLLEKLRASPAQVLLGSRVKLLGRTIVRRASRHYTGRVFATLASIALDLPVYDAQCGAKLFRVSPALAAALERPFRSRRAFDVELLQRLLLGAGGAPALAMEDVFEEPLEMWCDVPGSKVSLAASLRASFSLLALLGIRLRAQARARAGARARAASRGARGAVAGPRPVRGAVVESQPARIASS